MRKTAELGWRESKKCNSSKVTTVTFALDPPHREKGTRHRIFGREHKSEWVTQLSSSLAPGSLLYLICLFLDHAEYVQEEQMRRMDPVRPPRGGLDLDQAHAGALTHAPAMCSGVVPIATGYPTLNPGTIPLAEFFPPKDMFS